MKKPLSPMRKWKIGVVGSRRRNLKSDFDLLEKKIEEIWQDGDILVSGGCPEGADQFAEFIAKDQGLSILIHYPNWTKNGRTAGFARNTKIAEDCDFLIALPAKDRTGGTEDTIKKAKKLGKKIFLL